MREEPQPHSPVWSEGPAAASVHLTARFRGPSDPRAPHVLCKLCRSRPLPPSMVRLQSPKLQGQEIRHPSVDSWEGGRCGRPPASSRCSPGPCVLALADTGPFGNGSLMHWAMSQKAAPTLTEHTSSGGPTHTVGQPWAPSGRQPLGRSAVKWPEDPGLVGPLPHLLAVRGSSGLADPSESRHAHSLSEVMPADCGQGGRARPRPSISLAANHSSPLEWRQTVAQHQCHAGGCPVNSQIGLDRLEPVLLSSTSNHSHSAHASLMPLPGSALLLSCPSW